MPLAVLQEHLRLIDIATSKDWDELLTDFLKHSWPDKEQQHN